MRAVRAWLSSLAARMSDYMDRAYDAAPWTKSDDWKGPQS